MQQSSVLVKPLSAEIMKKALSRLDELLEKEVSLVIGGGGAMILAHGFPLSTMDIDAIPKGMDVAALDPLVKRIAVEQGLPPDWLNPYFSSFGHTLPTDYGDRLVEVFKGRLLRAEALGKNEMLIMKCFAHRQKDVGHARSLISGGADVKFVEAHMMGLLERKIPGSRQALDFLDDVLDQESP